MIAQRVVVALALCAVLCGCVNGGKRGAMSEDVAPSAIEPQRVINRDSMLAALAIHYEVLCEERKAAYAERDVLRRDELLDVNDKACAAFEDSLRVAMGR